MATPLPVPESGHPDFHETDAGGNCRFVGCDFNSDVDHYARISRGEDVYGFVAEAELDTRDRPSAQDEE